MTLASRGPLAARLREQEVVVLDGALATELERRGADLADPLGSARVLLEAPELVAAVHRDYLEAGADVITTASYQATVQGLMLRRLSRPDAEGVISSAVRLARDERDAFWADEGVRVGRSRPLVAASVGPYGAYLADGSEYHGDYGIGEGPLAVFHAPRMALLVAAGPDLLACETIPSLAEARALLVVLERHPGMTAWFSFSARDGTRLSSGEPMRDAAALLDGHPQVAAIGVNCTAPRHVPSLLREARSATSLPLVAYPNSGERYDAASHGWRGDRDGRGFAAQAREWVEAGARLVGGCCRTTPTDIAALRDWTSPLGSVEQGRRGPSPPVPGWR
ncbi:MAG: homocysteine S-methyltransferase [Gemmatimonadetes bacterium]|nr:homocysteine S-methyltransferase [Gemmatimonadota bacterium]